MESRKYRSSVTGFLAALAVLGLAAAPACALDLHGTYTDSVTFTNLTSGIGQSRSVDLNVVMPEFKLMASDGASWDYFSGSVSISDDRCIVGAEGDDDKGSDSGSAYVFEWNGTSWIQQAKLTASDGASGDLFGYSVSISGDRCIVGAWRDDDKGSDSGSAYIFKWNGTSWIQQAKLTASDGASFDYLGYSVSITGDRCIVGAEADDDKGSAYIFEWNGTTWSQKAKLTASDGAFGDWFGYSVTISSDRCIVGAYGDDDKGTESGSAYIFEWNGTSWSQKAKLTASDGASGDWFGYSVSISGDHCIVGANCDDDKGGDSGSAYIFKWNGTSWTQQAKLMPSDGAGWDHFGGSVSISGDRCIVGANCDDDKGGDSGSAYIFEWNGTSWSQKAKLTASDGAAEDYFGYSVSISDGRRIVGAWGDDDKGSYSGSAYVFGQGEALRITALVPPEDFIISGDQTGPFTPSMKMYELRNIGPNSIDWSANITQTWLGINTTAGTLAPGDSYTVELWLTEEVNSLPPGGYSDTITFTNTTSGVEQTRAVELTVLELPPPPAPPSNPDPADGAILVELDTLLQWNNSDTDGGSNDTSTSSTTPVNATTQTDPDAAAPTSTGDLEYSVVTNDDEIIIDASDRGWWDSDGYHTSSNKNTYTGGISGHEDRSFFVFDLRSVSESYFSNAILRLEIENYYGSEPFEPLTVSDVITPIDVLTASGSGNVAVYDDLGSGNSYANFDVVPSDVGSILEVTLSSQAISDIIAATGKFFAVGVKVNGIGSTQEGVRFSSGSESRVHQLVLTPGIAATYDVYFDTINPPVLLIQSDLNDTSCEPVPYPLDYNTTYYWQVIARNPGGQAPGPVWSFTTIGPPGEIEVTDSIPPVDDLNMPFGDVIVGLSRTEQITISNTDPDYGLIVDLRPQFEGFYDEFPSTTLDPDKWKSVKGVPTIDNIGLNEPSEPYSLRLNGYPDGGDGVESVTMDLSGFESGSLELTYWWEQTGGGESPDPSEDLVISYWNGSGWIELSRHPGDGPSMTYYDQETIVLPPGAMHSEFKLQISSTGTSGPYDDWFVDDISIISTSGGAPLTGVFQLENCPNFPAVIQPLDCISFDVNFTPDDFIDYESVLLLTSNDTDESEIEILISGTGILDYLEITPDANFVFSGHPGGPFVPSNRPYLLTNIGPINIDWVVDSNVVWLDFSPSSGTLSPGKSVTVMVATNAQADAMAEGYHCGYINFLDVITTLEQRRAVYLNVYTEPKIWASPYSFEVTVPQRCNDIQILTIGNTGGSALEFTLSSYQTSFTPPAAQAAAFDLVLADSNVVVPPEYDFTVLADDAAFAPDRLLVRFAPQPDKVWPDIAQQNKILAATGIATVEQQYKIVPGLSLVKLPAGVTVEEALVSFNRTEGVLYAQPDYVLTIDSIQQYIPNDPYFNDLWGMHNLGQTGGMVDADIDAPEAWDVWTGNKDIVVAVIDTGVDYTHPDLAANMWVNEAEFNGTTGVDDDGNGYVDDIYGYDFCTYGKSRDSDPMDDHYHGTHCAGTIGAVGNNGIGVAGVCWDVRIMAIKWMNSGGYGYTSDAIASVEYATLMGANLSSNSWRQENTSIPNPALENAINNAGTAGLLFVASAGNDGINNDTSPHYPSSYTCENIIAVLSTDHYDNRSSFSCYGPVSVDIGAPGSNIYSCQPGNRYQYLSGTSMAGPHVAGACALIWSFCPSLTHLEVKDIILRTVDPTLPGLCVSGGRLNVNQAILEVEASCEMPSGGGWIEFIPKMGTVAAGGEIDVNVIFKADCNAGTYRGWIDISSNDPYEGDLPVEVTMTVEPIDYFTELFNPGFPIDPNDPNCNDMSYRTLTLRPDGSGSYKACINDANDFPVDPNGGTVISLRDDDYVPVVLSDAHINFYGTDYDVFYIGSNGYISFISGDIRRSESLVDHFDLPRISGLFDDLDPSAGGLISWKQLNDRVVVTFENVPEYSLANSNSFQIEMRYDGKIRITWLGIDAYDGLVGLSDGYGLPLYFSETNLSGYGVCNFVGDLNGDFDTDFADFAILASYWCEPYEVTTTETVFDQFNYISYSGNDGTQNWSNDWQEIGESDGPSKGDVRIINSFESCVLRIGRFAKGKGLVREADLSGATSAVLTFDWWRSSSYRGNNTTVDISSDGGSTWSTLLTVPSGHSTISRSESFDISAYIASNTKIRFIGNGRDNGYIYFDNVQIEYDITYTKDSWCHECDFNHDFKIDSWDLQVLSERWLQ